MGSGRTAGGAEAALEEPTSDRVAAHAGGSPCKDCGLLDEDSISSSAGKIKDAKWLGQGTIYPDVIESVSVNGPSKRTKSLLIKLPTNYPKQFMEFIISYRTNHTLIQKNYFSN